MADLSGVHFEYAGVSSRLYGLITGNVETERYRKLSGDISGMTIFNKKNTRRYLVDDDYADSPLSFEIEIVREDCMPIPLHERRQIEKWLFNRGKYKKFYLDVEDDCMGETTELIDGLQKRLYMNCRFLNPERLEYNGGIVGYKATLEADSGFWWQDAVTKTYDKPAGAGNTWSFTVSTDSDIDDYIYPIIKIVAGNASGEIKLINTSDSDERIFTVTASTAGTTINIDCSTNYVSGGQYGLLNNRNFPRLLDGDNTFTVQGSAASVEITFQNRRFI